jgi:Fibrinogen beta and gamma chains, C-terminal globular domain
MLVNCQVVILMNCHDDAFKIQRSSSSSWYWVEYSSFTVASSANLYTLTVSGSFAGDAGDSLRNPGWNSNGKLFQTFDNIPTNYCITMGVSSWQCAANNGGWWYACCAASLLNADGSGQWLSKSMTDTGSRVFDIVSSRMFAELA